MVLNLTSSHLAAVMQDLLLFTLPVLSVCYAQSLCRQQRRS
jgi:hypothetical protein